MPSWLCSVPGDLSHEDAYGTTAHPDHAETSNCRSCCSKRIIQEVLYDDTCSDKISVRHRERQAYVYVRQ
jgi:hypothetical protein